MIDGARSSTSTAAQQKSKVPSIQAFNAKEGITVFSSVKQARLVDDAGGKPKHRMTQMGYVWGVGRVRSSKYLVGAKKERVNHRLGGGCHAKGQH